MNRKAVDGWLKMHERNVFFRGMTVWMGFNTVQIPFEVVPRSAGQSTWSVLKRLKLALVGITAFFVVPIALGHIRWRDFSSFIGYSGAGNVISETNRSGGQRFRYCHSLELIIGSLLMISLGIIGEYLARIYEEVKGRPRYLVKESIELGEANQDSGDSIEG